MKSILVCGLGRFGYHIAKKFAELGNEVLVVDSDEARINDALPHVTNGLIGDCTNEQFIASLDVPNFDICVVAIGDNFQSSLETTALLKDYGAKHVLSLATRDVHAKFLLRNGADEIVYAEKEMAERLAVKHSNNNIFDYIELTSDYSIYEISVPRDWVGKSITEAAIRSNHHVMILATKQDGALFPAPRADYVFTGKETLMIMGRNEFVRKLVQKG